MWKSPRAITLLVRHSPQPKRKIIAINGQLKNNKKKYEALKF